MCAASAKRIAREAFGCPAMASIRSGREVLRLDLIPDRDEILGRKLVGGVVWSPSRSRPCG